MAVFFSRQLGDYVAGEFCTCGHLKSEHGSLLHKPHMIREAGGGNCCSGHCECLQFTFQRFATVEEVAQKIKSRRQAVA